PHGYYCDAIGATHPKPCPVKTYNPKAGSTSSQACIKCPVGTFNRVIGQSSCRRCPSRRACA
ncbi:unnamed protein product, partial [Rotaria sp. Silwood1]